MTIPLWIFLSLWLVAVGFTPSWPGFRASRCCGTGLAGPGTYGAVILFLGCAGLTLLVAGGYLAAADWNTTLSILAVFGGSPVGHLFVIALDHLPGSPVQERHVAVIRRHPITLLPLFLSTLLLFLIIPGGAFRRPGRLSERLHRPGLPRLGVMGPRCSSCSASCSCSRRSWNIG